MKIFTTTNISFFFILMLAGNINAQTWCTPTVTPYNNNMPGITNVTFNTINRNSPALESPTSNYINTGISTTVVRGNTYSFSMTFNIDASICPDMNLRVWIDFNIDGQLNDPGEDVVNVNNQLPGTYTANITIPAGATLGTTRMRVTSKMTSNGGHTLPTPCNVPADPIGYHGGVEDYTVVITGASGINDFSGLLGSVEIMPNPARGNTLLSYNTASASVINAGVYSITGQQVVSLAANESVSAGEHTFFINTAVLEPGIYFVVLKAGGGSALIRKLVVL